ncbi:magnesium transporter CorA family protein [Chloroflexota bacterium]
MNSPNIQSIIWNRLTWINIEKPNSQHIEYLAQHYPFHKLELDDCLSRVQMPKVDEHIDEGYIFMVFHFPVFNPQARVTTSSQVSIFQGEDYLISLHDGSLKPLVKQFVDCEMNEDAKMENMGRSSAYLLYLILDRLVTYGFPILFKIGENIDTVEEKVFGTKAREAVRDISMLRRDVIAYRRIIRPQTEAFEFLESTEWPLLKEDPDVYFGDLADHSRKIRDTLDEYKEVLEGLNDTNNTLASFHTNQVIRVLTIISTIMLPLTLIASILGMNIYPMPVDEPLALAAVVVAMILLVAGMLAFFRYKRWV